MRFVTFDLETHLIKPGCIAPRMVCLSWAVDAATGLLDRRDGLAWAERQLRDLDVTLVGHQIYYDLGVLCAEDPVIFVPLVFKAFDSFRVRDTIVRQQLIDIAVGNLKYVWDEQKEEYVKTGYHLADLSLRLLGRVLPKEDTWRLKYALLDGVPISEWPEDAKKYAIDDSLTTRDVFLVQAESAGGDLLTGGTIPTEERATREAWALYLMSMWGVRTDGEAVAKLRAELEVRQKEAMAKLATTGIIKPKGVGWSRDMKTIYARVEAGFVAQGKDVPRTGKGKVSTEYEALVDCKDPDLAVLAEASGDAKLLSTYVPMLEHGTRYPINARYNVLVESNRTSCSKPNCFDGATELLTEFGWIRFDEYVSGRVAQFHPHDGTVDLVNPISRISYFASDLVHVRSERNIDLLVTRDHRCLLRHRKTGEWKVFNAADYPEDWQQVHGGKYIGGSGLPLTDDELRLLVATQADGSYHDGGIDFSFRKRRKIERLRSILKAIGCAYSDRPPTKAKVETRFRVRTNDPVVSKVVTLLGPEKVFGSWLLRMTRAQTDLFVDELFHWDGLFTRRTNYASRLMRNADWAQIVLALSGARARRRTYTRPNTISEQVDVTWRDYSLTTNRTIEEAPGQHVYCVTVPSSYLLVRRGRVTMVTGNCQNPPRKGGVRDCFVPRPGYVYCSVDYDTIELRSLAQSCLDLVGHSAMAEALRKGEDLHLNLAADFMGISREEAAARLSAGDDDVAEQRQLMKPANFGFPGGMAPDSFVDYAKGYDFDIDRGLAKRIHEQWHLAWPEMKHYFNYVSSVVGTVGEGTVVSPRSGFVRGGLSFTQLSNHYFQSLTATGAKDALWHVSRECYSVPESPLYGCRPIIFMHDEVITEMPEERASAAAERQAEVMVEVMQRWIPDIPIKASPVLMRRWLKGAKPVRVDGRLVPSKSVKEDGKVKWVPDVQALGAAVDRIDSFRGQHFFLSNFSRAQVLLGGTAYPTSEHAYQALKCANLEDAEIIRQAPTPGEAKKLGRLANTKAAWRAERLPNMLAVLRAKFSTPDLAAKLLGTGSAVLVERNTWGDKFWGVCNGSGENYLGRLLTQVREELRGIKCVSG